jgi:hypothetical protein
LRRDGSEGADAHAQQHGEENLEVKQIQKALSGRAEKRTFHGIKLCLTQHE